MPGGGDVDGVVDEGGDGDDDGCGVAAGASFGAVVDAGA